MPVIFGTIGLNVNANAAAVAANAPVAAGQSGELLASELHGKFYSAARAGNVFHLNTAAAGTTVPVQTTNLVSTFTIWNPLGSGKNVELIRYSYGLLNATTVVSDVTLYVQPGVGQAVTAPGTLTLLTIRNALGFNASGGAGITSVCTGYSAATLVNTMGTNMFVGPTLLSFGAVTTTNATPINYDFDGSVILPPGTLATTAGTAAQAQAARQSLSWAEWPV
jgi:hypothetical protein